MDNIILETMETYNEYTNNIVVGCNNIVDSIRKNDTQTALQLISQFSEGVTWLINVNKRLDKLGYVNKLDNENIIEFLISVNDGLEIKDFVLVSDMFEYEIKPFFQNVPHYKIFNDI